MVKVANVAIAVFVVSVVMRRSRTKKLDKCLQVVNALLRLLTENGSFREAFERWTLQVIRDWYEDGECVILAPCTKQPVRASHRYLPLVRHYCLKSIECEPLIRYSVATMTPMWRPVVSATKVFNLLTDERMDWPEIAVVCTDSRIPTRLLEWHPSGVRRCVTLNAVRQEDQERRRLLLTEVLKDAELFLDATRETGCSATFLSSADVVKGFLDVDTLGDSIFLDADDVVDVLLRLRSENKQGPRAVFWLQESQTFEAALTLSEHELVRAVSERAVTAGILFEGKALEDAFEEVVTLK